MRRIYPKDKTETGRLLDAIYKDTGQDFLFSNGEISERASEWFYAWTCGEDYVRNLLEIGKMILKIEVPRSLHAYVEEARTCFALDQYIAVCSLSRTIIEGFLLHLCEEIGKEPDKTEHGNPKMSSVFEIASKGDKDRENKLWKVYGRASKTIHGGKTASRENSKEIFRETIDLIQGIFDFHEA